MPELPKSIRVGYRDYTVEGFSAHEGANRGRLGECLTDMGVIRIRADLSKEETAKVLLHEALHAAYHNGALEDEDREERIVTVLANQLTQLWADNPALVRFITHSLDGKPHYTLDDLIKE